MAIIRIIIIINRLTRCRYTCTLTSNLVVKFPTAIFLSLGPARQDVAKVLKPPLEYSQAAMHLMYYLDSEGKRVYTLEVRFKAFSNDQFARTTLYSRLTYRYSVTPWHTHTHTHTHSYRKWTPQGNPPYLHTLVSPTDTESGDAQSHFWLNIRFSFRWSPVVGSVLMCVMMSVLHTVWLCMA